MPRRIPKALSTLRALRSWITGLKRFQGEQTDFRGYTIRTVDPELWDAIQAENERRPESRFRVLMDRKIGPLFLTLPTILSTGQIFNALSGHGLSLKKPSEQFVDAGVTHTQMREVSANRPIDAPQQRAEAETLFQQLLNLRIRCRRYQLLCHAHGRRDVLSLPAIPDRRGNNHAWIGALRRPL